MRERVPYLVMTQIRLQAGRAGRVIIVCRGRDVRVPLCSLRVGRGGVRVRGCDDRFGEGEDREGGCKGCESGHCVISCNGRAGRFWGDSGGEELDTVALKKWDEWCFGIAVFGQAAARDWDASFSLT